jgi:hypothetical protein
MNVLSGGLTPPPVDAPRPCVSAYWETKRWLDAARSGRLDD